MNAVGGICGDCSTSPTTATGSAWAAWLRTCSRRASGRNQTSSLMNMHEVAGGLAQALVALHRGQSLVARHQVDG